MAISLLLNDEISSLRDNCYDVECKELLKDMKKTHFGIWKRKNVR